MRHYTIIALLLFVKTFTFAQIVNDDMAFFNYTYNKNLFKINKVETVSIESFFSGKKSAATTIYYFDKNGLLTKRTLKDRMGVVKNETYFITNSKNDIASKIQNDYEYKKFDTAIFYKLYDGKRLIKDSSSEIPIGYNYDYDKMGILLKTTIYLNSSLGNNSKRIIINNLDSLKRIKNIVETLYQNNENTTSTEYSNRDIFYNKNGKVEKEIEKLNSKYSWMCNNGSVNYLYDSVGNLIKSNRANAASYTYTYNDNGLIATKQMEMKVEKDAFMDTNIDITTLEIYKYIFRK